MGQTITFKDIRIWMALALFITSMVSVYRHNIWQVWFGFFIAWMLFGAGVAWVELRK